MAVTPEDLYIPTYAAPKQLAGSIAALVRFVSPRKSLRADLARSIAAAERFLDIDRTTKASQAPSLQNSVLEDTTQIDIAEHSLRSSLVAFSQPEVRTAKVGKFTTITIRVGSDDNDIVRINTIRSSIIGSALIYNIGPYGNTTKITSVINVLREVLQGTENPLVTQKALFARIEERVKNGQTINKEDLYKLNPTFRALDEFEVKARLQRLRAMIYLITNYETTRRPRYADSIGYKQKAAEATEQTVLCAEIILDSWTKVLKLLQTATLTVDQVFAQDAPYGLPTAKILRKKLEAELLRKIRQVNTLYMQTFYPIAVVAAASFGKVAIPSMEEAHKRLVKSTTLINESPGKIYKTPDLSNKRKNYNNSTIEVDAKVKMQLKFVDEYAEDQVDTKFANEETISRTRSGSERSIKRRLERTHPSPALLWQSQMIEKQKKPNLSVKGAEADKSIAAPAFLRSQGEIASSAKCAMQW